MQASEKAMTHSGLCDTFLPRSRRCLMAILLSLAAYALGPAAAKADDGGTLRVMTQNLYAGSFFLEFAAATTASDYITAATIIYQHILATRPAERAAVIADEIAALRPDFVGLEQAAIVRTGIARPATAVTVDMLQSLLQELAARGVRYETVAVTPGLDAEVPTTTTLGFNARLTLRDALIVRADLIEQGHVKLSNLQIRHYVASPLTATPFGVVGDNEGYAAIDVAWRGRQFRFVTTHFNTSPALAIPQALELVQTRANTTLPIVLVCDCNANPDNPNDSIFHTYPAYLVLKNAGFVDVFRTARPNDSGFTFGQAENLLNVTSLMSHRIDLVQFRGPFTIEDVRVVGASPGDRLRLGLWPSDHAGVVATLTLRSGNDAD
jgi:endonuclease/exonuclease/phosphatase family metal-dependent hydrolase